MRFHPQLTDESTSVEVKNGVTNTTTRKITTKIPSSAWFSSAQTIAKFKALQTDKTQSIGGDNLGQHGATNTVGLIKEMAELLREMNRMKMP